MAGEIVDIGKTTDAGLAGIMRRQMGMDILAGTKVPTMQQLIVEAIARLLEQKDKATPAVTTPGQIQVLKPFEKGLRS